jgi:hypothetical protein
MKNPVQRFFHITKKKDKEYIEKDDFGIYMKELLETHQGLDFLK